MLRGSEKVAALQLPGNNCKTVINVNDEKLINKVDTRLRWNATVMVTIVLVGCAV